jgi:hypothetical protein
MAGSARFARGEIGVEVTPELRERVAEIDPELLDAAIALELRDRRERAIAATRGERVDKPERKQQPTRGRFRAVTSGSHKRSLRPQSKVEDRKYVAGALRHWRLIHDLAPAQAQARIGYSPRSTSWSHWESGYVVPPYETLLRIIAATGLGLAADLDDRRRDIEPSMLLEYQRAQHLQRVKRRRRARQTRVAQLR